MKSSRLNFSNSRKKAIGSYIVEAAQYEPKRSMSNSRLGNTILTWIAAIVLCYTSLFYIPSLLNINMILGTSTSMDSKNEINTDPNAPWYTPAVNLLRLKRGYFQAGSHIKVAYNSTAGTNITLVYSQCSGIPILEVYSCPQGPVHKVVVDGHQGAVNIPVHKSGFYMFSQIVEYEKDLNETGKFAILWGR